MSRPTRPIGILFIIIFLSGVRRTAVSATEILAEHATLSIGGNLLARLHVAKLRTSAIKSHMTVEDINGDITLNRSGCINTTAIESIHVSIVDLPMHITLVCAARFTYLLLTCSGSLFKITATDVTLGVVIRYCCILVVSTGKVELIICSTGHGNRFMRRRLASVAMSTQTK